MSAAASRVAVHPAVRTALLERQRAFRRPPGLVADGRDMGTVVFPDATLKVFLTASQEERAERRYKQLIEKGISSTLESLLRDIRERDARDAERAVAPLAPAADAVILDTTGMTIAAAVRFVLDRYLALGPGTGGERARASLDVSELTGPASAGAAPSCLKQAVPNALAGAAERIRPPARRARKRVLAHGGLER